MSRLREAVRIRHRAAGFVGRRRTRRRPTISTNSCICSRKAQHGQVSFVEQHFLALLKRPVESDGELIYEAPDRLEKRTLEPRSESLVLDGDVLTVRRGQRRRVVDLKAYPQILPFVESIRATLAGDRAALERVFRVDVYRRSGALDTDPGAARGASREDGVAGADRRIAGHSADGGN